MQLLRLNLFFVLFCIWANAADSLQEAFAKGKIDGSLQFWQINDWFGGEQGAQKGSSANPLDRSEYALGGVLHYETDYYYGISGGATFTSSNIMSQSPKLFYTASEMGQTTSSAVPSINYNANTLNEAYLLGKSGGATLQIGDQAISSPLATSDGARIFFNTFRGAQFSYDTIFNTKIKALYLNAIQTRTTSMYLPGGPSPQEAINKGFEGMTQSVFGSFSSQIANGANNPVYALSLSNAALQGAKFEAWFYNAVNLFNALYLQADYKIKISNSIQAFGAVQYINQSGIGATQSSFKTSPIISQDLGYLYCNNEAQNGCSAGIKSEFYALKAGVSYENFTASGAISSTAAHTDAVFDGSLMLPWGNTALFTNNMIANPTAGGTNAIKWMVEYDFDKVLKGLYASFSYAKYFANSLCTSAYTTSGPFGGMKTAIGDIGYSSSYLRVKYQVNKPFSLEWKIEKNLLNEPTTSTPQSAIESRFIAKYVF